MIVVNEFLKTILTACGGALITALFTYRASLSSTQVDQYTADSERMDMLWKKIDQLTTNNAKLTQTVEELREENMRLVKQVNSLTDQVTHLSEELRKERSKNGQQNH